MPRDSEQHGARVPAPTAEQMLELLQKSPNAAVKLALEAAEMKVRTDNMEAVVDALLGWSQRMGYTIRKLLDDLLAMGDELPPDARDLVTDGRDAVGGLIVELREILGADGPADADEESR